MGLGNACICLVFLSLCSGLGWAVPEACADEASLEAGKKLFRAHCKSCHGKEGRGDGTAAAGLDPPPRNLREDPFKGGEGAQEIFFTLSNGRPGTAMPDFKLVSEEDRWLLVRFVQSLRKKT